MGRDADLADSIHILGVSTHAPAWGAINIDNQLQYLYQFQLTRPHGARCVGNWTMQSPGKFQLTRPHGARFNIY